MVLFERGMFGSLFLERWRCKPVLTLKRSALMKGTASGVKLLQGTRSTRTLFSDWGSYSAVLVQILPEVSSLVLFWTFQTSLKIVLTHHCSSEFCRSIQYFLVFLQQLWACHESSLFLTLRSISRSPEPFSTLYFCLFVFSSSSKHQSLDQRHRWHRHDEVSPSKCRHEAGRLRPGLRQQHFLQTVHPTTGEWRTLQHRAEWVRTQTNPNPS